MTDKTQIARQVRLTSQMDQLMAEAKVQLDALQQEILEDPEILERDDLASFNKVMKIGSLRSTLRMLSDKPELAAIILGTMYGALQQTKLPPEQTFPAYELYGHLLLVRMAMHTEMHTGMYVTEHLLAISRKIFNWKGYEK